MALPFFGVGMKKDLFQSCGHCRVFQGKAKGKGEKGRYTHLNAQFQRIARTDKVFLSDQCKQREEKIEWERLEISSRKLDIKGTFHVKMDTMKERNGMDLTEEEGIKKRWQEYTEDLYKKILMTQITMMV